MAYTPDVFADDEAGGTPITAAKLNKLGQGVQAVAVTADEAAASVTALDGRLDVLEAAPSGTSGLDDLTDVVITTPTEGQVLKRVGTQWVNAADQGGASYDVGPSGAVLVSNGTTYIPVTPENGTAADVPFSPAGGVAADNVQAAIEELDAEKAASTHSHAPAGITVQDENGTVATGVTQIDFAGAAVTAAAGTGEVVVTVTGGGGSGAVGEGRLILGGTTYLSQPGVIASAGVSTATQLSSAIHYSPLVVQEASTCDALVLEVTTAGSAGSLGRAAIYAASEDWVAGALVGESDTFALDTTGVRTTVLLGGAKSLPPGRYLTAVRHDSSTGVGFRHTASPPSLGWAPTLGSNPGVGNLAQAGVTGSSAQFPTTAPTLTLGANGNVINRVFLRLTGV